jgi:putative spermidine/putrescine transport system permease protein
MLLLSPGQKALAAAIGTVVLAFLIVPVVIVFPVSFGNSEFLKFPPDGWTLRWYAEYFGSRQWMRATGISFQVAIATTAIAVPVGTAAAYGLHTCGLRWTRLIQLLLLTPMIVPIIIVAIGVFFTFVTLGLLGTLTGLVVAHVMHALPYVIVTTYSGLRAFDMTQEMVARSLGVSRPRAFFLVTLPQIRTSIVVASLFAFLSSLDEVVIALFISQGSTSTLTREMFISIREQIHPTIAAISSLFVTATLTLALFAYLAQSAKKRPE